MPQYEELNTLRSFTAKLNTALSAPGIVVRLSDLLVENNLVGRAAAQNITSPLGIDDYSKASKLTSGVYTYVKTVSTQEKATELFNKLVLILYDNLELKDMAQQLVDHRGKEDSSYKSPLPSDTAASEATGVSSNTECIPKDITKKTSAEATGVSSSAECTPKDSMKTKPTLAQLHLLKLKSETGEEIERIEIIKTLAPKWKEFCTAFDFDPTGVQLENFVARFSGNQIDPAEPCQAVFRHWLNGNGVDVTWEKLVELIKDNYKIHFAQQIEDFLKKM